MNSNSRIYVAGRNGLLGSAIVRALRRFGYNNILTSNRLALDLTDHLQVEKFFAGRLPEYVFLCAARVGSIAENISYPAEFLFDNAQIELNVINNAHLYGVNKVLFFGSNCFYPVNCPQPISEDFYMTGSPEPTNLSYATAKILGLEMCRAYNKQYRATSYVCAVPASMYGPGDRFDLSRSHVLASLVIKFSEAASSNSPEVILWGDGSPMREFIYVDDVANAAVFMMNDYNPTADEINRGDIFMNVGTRVDISIKNLAETVGRIVGFSGKITWDERKPNGAARKLLDSSRIYNRGWRPQTNLEDGIRLTYQQYSRRKRAKQP